MSTNYMFSIDILGHTNSKVSASYIIDSFIRNGWSPFSENNEFIFTDVGDIDDFNYVSQAISIDDFHKIAKKKEENQETIAFALFQIENDKRYRIDVMIYDDYKISVSPDDYTKRMLSGNDKILDVNWYLDKIIPILSNDNIIVGSFSYFQC